MLPHNFYDNTSFVKPTRSIHILFSLISIFGFKWLSSFRGFSILITWLVKYGRDLNLSKESSMEKACLKQLETLLTNTLMTNLLLKTPRNKETRETVL